MRPAARARQAEAEAWLASGLGDARDTLHAAIEAAIEAAAEWDTGGDPSDVVAWIACSMQGLGLTVERLAAEVRLIDGSPTPATD